MPQISKQEFERLPLRIHEFLAGVPLHDVWAIDLPRTRSGITLDEFLRTAGTRPRVGCDCCKDDRSGKGSVLTRSPVVRTLLNIRLFVGRLLGWDREPASTAWEPFATRLTTVVETANAYRFYFGVYVRSVGRFTPVYMALIDPFRKLVVYPALLRTVRASWDQTFGKA